MKKKTGGGEEGKQINSNTDCIIVIHLLKSYGERERERVRQTDRQTETEKEREK